MSFRIDDAKESTESAASMPIENDLISDIMLSSYTEQLNEEEEDIVSVDKNDAEMILQHEASVVRHSENLSNFIRNLATKLNITTEDEEEMKRQITEKVDSLIHQRSLSSNQVDSSISKISNESIGFLVQNKELREKRIKELEDEGKEKTNLLEIMQKEIEQTKKELKDQKLRADTLESISLKFAALIPNAETWESAYNGLKQIQERVVYLEESNNDNNFDKIIADMQKDQQIALENMQKQLDQQNKLILEYQRRLSINTKPVIDDDMVKNIESKISNTNEMLRSRLEEIKDANNEEADQNYKRPIRTGKALTPKPNRFRRRIIDDSVDKELSECIWMAKTREMLALERKILKTDLEIDNASNKLQYLTQEKIISQRKLNGTPKRENQTTVIYPSTLL